MKKFYNLQACSIVSFQSKFTSLSLAFKTDSQTLEKRLEIQERSRDIAEQNVDKELQGLRTGLAVSMLPSPLAILD